jgi:hypothetical protein
LGEAFSLFLRFSQMGSKTVDLCTIKGVFSVWEAKLQRSSWASPFNGPKGPLSAGGILWNLKNSALRQEIA